MEPVRPNFTLLNDDPFQHVKTLPYPKKSFFNRLFKPVRSFYKTIKKSLDQEDMHHENNQKWKPIIGADMVAAGIFATLSTSYLIYKGFHTLTTPVIPENPGDTLYLKTMNLRHAVGLATIVIAGILCRISSPRDLLNLTALTPVKTPDPMTSPPNSPSYSEGGIFHNSDEEDVSKTENSLLQSGNNSFIGAPESPFKKSHISGSKVNFQNISSIKKPQNGKRERIRPVPLNLTKSTGLSYLESPTKGKDNGSTLNSSSVLDNESLDDLDSLSHLGNESFDGFASFSDSSTMLKKEIADLNARSKTNSVLGNESFDGFASTSSLGDSSLAPFASLTNLDEEEEDLYMSATSLERQVIMHTPYTPYNPNKR
jgi:hypothetical protein